MVASRSRALPAPQAWPQLAQVGIMKLLLCFARTGVKSPANAKVREFGSRPEPRRQPDPLPDHLVFPSWFIAAYKSLILNGN